MISLKLVAVGTNYNIFVYTPEQSCSEKERNGSWNQLSDSITLVPDNLQLMLARDLNGHIRQDREGYKRWHGSTTIGQRNEEGKRLLDIDGSII